MEQKKLSDKAVLGEILGYFQQNIARFSTKIGVEKQRLYDLNVGKTQAFTREVLIGIVKNCPEISPYWLITGEGSMLAGTAAHHNAVATDHGKATVNHTEGGSVLESQQATIRDQAETIKQLTLLLAKK